MGLNSSLSALATAGLRSCGVNFETWSAIDDTLPGGSACYQVFFVVFVHLAYRRIDEWLEPIPLTLDPELFFAFQVCRREQDELNKCQDTVVLDDLRNSDSFPNLFGHDLGGVDKIDFAI